MSTSCQADREPVDFQASKLFWKAPWWAHAPHAVKKAVLQVKARAEVTWEAWIDYTAKPPRLPGPPGMQIHDRIGQRYRSQGGKECVVIGYCCGGTPCMKTVSPGKADAPQMPAWWRKDGPEQWQPRRSRAVHYWWAVCEGEIIRVRLGSIPKKSRWTLVTPPDPK